MADEYIRKADALDAAKFTYIECLYEDEEGYIEGEADEIPVVFKRDIEAIPAADVRPVVHGRWIAASDTSGNEYYRCSECGTYFERTFFGNDYTVNGCPVCFADMRGNTDQEQGADNSAHRDICGATGLPCCRCNPGACESRK